MQQGHFLKSTRDPTAIKAPSLQCTLEDFVLKDLVRYYTLQRVHIRTNVGLGVLIIVQHFKRHCLHL